jgi:hypothetical protein
MLKRLFGGILFISFSGVLLLSCSSAPGQVGASGGGGNAGNGTVNIDLTAGAAGTSSGAGGSISDPSSTAGSCGSTTTDTTRAQADVLIVLDRTSSMISSLSSNNNCAANDPTCTSRMTAVVAGVGQVVTNNPGIHWGLELFTTPGGGQCVVSPTPQVAISADSSAAIKTVLASITNEQSTPTALALTVATNYLKTVNDGNSKAILLATDGEPNCGTGGGTSGSDLAGATVAAKAAYGAGFPVYVIGIGPSVSNLNALAQAGGTGSYYPATSTTDLTSALSSIAKVVSATCTFKANATPPDKNLVYVYVDKALVAKSDSNGWVFDSADPTSATVVLTGTYCQNMLSGVTSRVQIVFGCPNTVPASVIP